MALRDMDKKTAEVIGKSINKNKSKKDVFFDLSFREIKHIRRCALLYLKIHPILDNDRAKEENLSKKIHKKFERFGRGKRRIPRKILEKRMNNREQICSWEGCNSKDNLEIDHIRPLSADGKNLGQNLRYLCKKHHRVREIIYILKRKEAEVIKLKEEKDNLLNDHKLN